MEQIENYNCDGLCAEKYCSERYSKFTIIEQNGMLIVIGFCDKHGEEYENVGLKNGN